MNYNKDNGLLNMIRTDPMIIIILNCVLIIGCGSPIPCTHYFTQKSAEEIEKIAEDTLTFKTSYIDNMFKSLGIILEPNIPFDIKYDTLSRYTIIVGGNIIFSDTQEGHNTDIKCDSIELSYVIVKREGEKARRYSNRIDYKSVIDKPWKECPIPSTIMKEIRRDFFIRMKYRKYRVINNDSLKGLTVMHQYQLF